jgi:hypothetical protein
MPLEWLGTHYCAVYSTAERSGEDCCELTPVRPSVEAVLADLVRLAGEEASFRQAMVIDLSTFETIEPMAATLARLALPRPMSAG